MFWSVKDSKETVCYVCSGNQCDWFLANWFCSEEEIAQIKEENSVKDTTEVTDTSLITIDTTKNEDVPDIQIIDVKGLLTEES